MAAYTHLFVMDPIEDLNLKLDSSLRMAESLTRTGQRCFITSPKQISLHESMKDSDASANVRELAFPTRSLEDMQISDLDSKKLRSFSAIHMRKDPPFDMAYVACTWLLEKARGYAKVYNDPEALRRWNEKLLIFEFPEFTNPGLVSSDASELLNFTKHHANNDAIIKPLDLFGGRGVRRLNLIHTAEHELEKVLQQETDHGKSWRLIQPFDKAIFEGEVRVFTAGGEPLAWSLKVPRKGQYLANTGAGAVVEPYIPTKAEAKMVKTISKSLLSKGIFLTGFDIIGGKISEINITSPRMLIAQIDPHDHYDQFAELVTKDLRN